MSSPRPNGGITLVEVTNPRVLETLARIDAMSDGEIRELVEGEPPIIVEAGEGIIADRRAEHDYVALVAAGAEAGQLEAQLEAADREASDRDADLAALVVAQMQELVNAVAGRLP